MGRYKFNNIDVSDVFGVKILKGIDSQLMKIPDLKNNGLSINWAGENGTERYYGNRKFESKTYIMQCLIIGVDKSDLISKYDSLESFLMNEELFNFDDVLNNRRYKVFFNKMNIDKKERNWMLISIELIDDFPTDKFTVQ